MLLLKTLVTTILLESNIMSTSKVSENKFLMRQSHSIHSCLVGNQGADCTVPIVTDYLPGRHEQRCVTVQLSIHKDLMCTMLATLDVHVFLVHARVGLHPSNW